MGGTHPVLDGGGYPIQSWMGGTPSSLGQGATPGYPLILILDGGTPPHPADGGYPPLQTWDGVTPPPPHLDLRRGTPLPPPPSGLETGYPPPSPPPPHLDLRRGTPLPHV